MALGKTTPILRIFDEQKAREFYVEFLGFHVDFEHRFQEDFPLYMGISRDGCIVHLSEHHGDCCPGAAVRIETEDVDVYQEELTKKNYRYNKPEINEMPWGREMSATDPFGNRLTFTTSTDT